MSSSVPFQIKPRCLIFIVARNAEPLLAGLLARIRVDLLLNYELEVLILDDGSNDRTFEVSQDLARQLRGRLAITVLVNRVRQGYGASQKLGFHFAAQQLHDYVVCIDTARDAAPELIGELLSALKEGQAEAVIVTRSSDSLLHRLQNRILRANLPAQGSGTSAFLVSALKRVPFQHNANHELFDTELAIQFQRAKIPFAALKLRQEHPHNGSPQLVRAYRMLATTVQARLQDLSLFYDRKFDCAETPVSQYSPKFGYRSPHSYSLESIPPGATVLDLGCAQGYMGAELRSKKHCVVTGVDSCPVPNNVLDRFFPRNLNAGLAGIPVEQHDYVLLLDVIEHLAAPERFLDELRERLSVNPNAELIISTGNVAFLITRLMLLFGKFNYGKRGILDLTHTRLFTFASMKTMLEQTGFAVSEVASIPAPFPLALGNNALSRALLAVNIALCKLAPGIFAYQMVLRAKPRPTLATLLQAAKNESHQREEGRSFMASGR